MRTISTRWLVALNLGAGLALGLLLGYQWAVMAEQASRRRWAEINFARFHRFVTELDSVYVPDDSVPAPGNRMSEGLPREVRRLQAMQHCVVSLAFLRGGTELELLYVTAQSDDLAPMRQGWTYRDGGYPDSSLVSVVLPHLRCEMIRSLGVGSSRIVLPPPVRTLPPTPARPPARAEETAF